MDNKLKDKIVIVNVGGVEFKLTRPILDKIPYFQDVDDWSDVVIPRPSYLFPYVVSIALQPGIYISNEVNSLVMIECDYFGLDYGMRQRAYRDKKAAIHVEEYNIERLKAILLDGFALVEKILVHYEGFISGSYVLNEVIPFKNIPPNDLDLYISDQYKDIIMEEFKIGQGQSIGITEVERIENFRYPATFITDVYDLTNLGDSKLKIQLIFHNKHGPAEVISWFDIDICQKYIRCITSEHASVPRYILASVTKLYEDKFDILISDPTMKHYLRVCKYIERGFTFKSAVCNGEKFDEVDGFKKYVSRPI